MRIWAAAKDAESLGIDGHGDSEAGSDPYARAIPMRPGPISICSAARPSPSSAETGNRTKAP